MLGADDNHWFVTNSGSEHVLTRYDGAEVTTLPIELTDPAVDQACVADVFGIGATALVDESSDSNVGNSPRPSRVSQETLTATRGAP